jgi:formylglycine-generating enzyme required for sulfatase activity
LLLVVIGGIAVGLYLYRRARPAAEKTFAFQTVQLDQGGAVISRKNGTAKYFTEDLGDGVILEMVQIPAGKFLMGSPESESDRPEERPQHQVNVPAFFMGRYEITQAQWRAVARLPKIKIDLNPNQSHWHGDTLPADQVSWDQAEEFCERLSRKAGRLYRLPSEAEWEYACRAGTTTPFGFGATLTMEIANYNGFPYRNARKEDARNTTIAVGSLGVANGFGLYDMHGNVTEWVLDTPHFNYTGAPTDGSPWYGGNGFGTNPRVLRGGGLVAASVCRCAYRDNLCDGCVSGTVGYARGFRVVAAAQ